MAAATKSIGFGVTVSTTYEQPFHLARRLSTVDHLTKGRLGWNVGNIRGEFAAILSKKYHRSSQATSTPQPET